jgi:ADP-ribose pyrophosphatase YjhB (NUDIX family)
MEINYCRRCGATLTEKRPYEYECANQHTIFLNPASACGAFIIDDEHNVTLSVRGIEPHKGMLDSFGGFIDPHETVEQGLARELTEEIGLSPSDYSLPQFICTATGNYPFGGEILYVLGSFFWIKLNPGVEIHPQDDVASVATMPLTDVPLDQLHDDDIREAITRLRMML